jgi:3-dehydroquinate dehydratase type I
VLAKTTHQAIREVEKLSAKVDLLEIRMDYQIDPLDLKKIRISTDTPLIATNREKSQGGYCEEGKKRVYDLIEASLLGYEFVDLEIKTPGLYSIVNKVHRNGSKVIISHHNFIATPSITELETLLMEGKKAGADIVKLIGTAQCQEDNLTYLKFNSKYPGNVSFGMGEFGTVSRVLCPVMGGAYTYASGAFGQESAPGQLTINHLKQVYSLLGVLG